MNYFLRIFLMVLMLSIPNTLLAKAKARATAASSSSSNDADFARLTYDLGASFGSYNSHSYTEINLGLNYFFEHWLAWRNSVFYRAVSGADNLTGLDSSLRAIYDTQSSALGLTTFAGAGYRFASSPYGAPLLEGGAIFKLGGVHIGGGVKVLLYSVNQSSYSNDTQYFIILGGGGVL